MLEYHSYDPAEGHRLPHDPFNSIVGPRPNRLDLEHGCG